MVSLGVIINILVYTNPVLITTTLILIGYKTWLICNSIPPPLMLLSQITSLLCAYQHRFIILVLCSYLLNHIRKRGTTNPKYINTDFYMYLCSYLYLILYLVRHPFSWFPLVLCPWFPLALSAYFKWLA